jgi:hypothetical protein
MLPQKFSAATTLIIFEAALVPPELAGAGWSAVLQPDTATAVAMAALRMAVRRCMSGLHLEVRVMRYAANEIGFHY